MTVRRPTRLLSLGVCFVVAGLALSGVAVAETAPASSVPGALAPVALGLLAFAGGVLAGRH